MNQLDAMFSSPMGELDAILKELNIKKTESVMTKLELIVNPFTCTIGISAKINGVEERAITDYNPFEYPSVSYFSLADRSFKMTVDYDDSFDVSVEDNNDGTLQPVTLKFKR
jgi:hypothetical protein